LNIFEAKILMGKESSAKAMTKFSFRKRIAAISAAAVAILLTIFAGLPSLRASEVSISSFRSTESTNATQRKSGGHPQSSQPQSSDPNSTQKGATVSQAKGTFEVKVDPQGDPDKAEGSTLARMSIDKKYHGDLEGTAKGTMLSAGTDVKGSAGYVAIERVTGTLNGKTGSFVLQHNATLTRGAPALNIIVVPDSGTGQLTGITGKFLIVIADGKHSYEFDYTLPPPVQ
jgi:Protein of unknown function (DUF3224)